MSKTPPAPQVRILLPTDHVQIVAFSKARLQARVGHAMEAELQSWSAPWRQESLEHYLPQGWSFAAIAEDGQIVAYALAQPVLFFRGLTQTLWVEHFEFATPEAGLQVMDTLYRWARDKHLQCVLVDNSEDNRACLKDWPQATAIQMDKIEIRSSRLK